MLQELIQKAVQVVPSPRQLAWQKMEFYAFTHISMNTFTNQEWGQGTESPEWFNPTDFDADQWVRAIKSAGMTGLIMTAKHHDGFCMWPSAYTDHSVKSSPWRKGTGDAVREVADACRRGGIRFGVYLSPWDRHEPTYGQGKAYNDFFLDQLRELAENYGDIFCFWFDGACGEGANGRRQEYDWPRYYQLIRELQPDAVITICGPDVRWCGNEAGHCRASEWSVVPASLVDNEKIAGSSQQEDSATFSRKFDSQDEDLGSRDAIAQADKLVWYPAEVDTSIRPGWFYHPEEDGQVRGLEELLSIYFNSVGGNACLLLNVPPDTRGLIAAPDSARLRELGDALHQLFSNDLTPYASASADQEEPEHPGKHILSDSGELFWKAPDGVERAAVTIQFDEERTFGLVVLQEHILSGQRVEAFELWANGDCVFSGTVIGYKRICRFAPVSAAALEIRITGSRVCPTLEAVRVFG